MAENYALVAAANVAASDPEPDVPRERPRRHKLEGEEFMAYPDGGRYTGQLKAGKREGQGVMTHASGNVHDGQWQADQPEGQGTLTSADGTSFTGQYKAGESAGPGVLTFSSGNRVEGNVSGGHFQDGAVCSVVSDRVSGAHGLVAPPASQEAVLPDSLLVNTLVLVPRPLSTARGTLQVGCTSRTPDSRVRRVPQNPRCVELTNPATNSTVYVVGVCHVSEQSELDVRQVIRDAQPDTVCIEHPGLAARLDLVLRKTAPRVLAAPELPVLWEKEAMLKLATFAIVSAVNLPLLQVATVPWFLDDHVRQCVSDLCGTQNGAEMEAAVEEAVLCGSACYAIDRDSDVTTARGAVEDRQCNLVRTGTILHEIVACQSPQLQHLKAKMGQMAEGPEPWSESDVLECRDLAQSYSVPDPSFFSLDASRHRDGIISHALGGERDEYLAHNIWRASQQPDSTTVAVVGAAHVPGIMRLFGHTTDARFKELDRLPAPCNPFEACVEAIAGHRDGTTCALDIATLAVPICAVARGYAAASQRFSQKVARCGLLGVGAAIAAAAAHATLDMQAKCHRIKSEVYRYDKSQRS